MDIETIWKKPRGTILANTHSRLSYQKCDCYRSIQEAIFKHPSSAKGNTRGYGTYSMRLLSEQIYAQIDFTTDEVESTSFYLKLPVQI